MHKVTESLFSWNFSLSGTLGEVKKRKEMGDAAGKKN